MEAAFGKLYVGIHHQMCGVSVRSALLAWHLESTRSRVIAVDQDMTSLPSQPIKDAMLKLIILRRRRVEPPSPGADHHPRSVVHSVRDHEAVRQLAVVQGPRDRFAAQAAASNRRVTCCRLGSQGG